MKQKLVINQSLQWKMNQSLYQSIEILQLTGMELYDYMKQVAEENPLIEEVQPIDKELISQFRTTDYSIDEMNTAEQSLYDQLKSNLYVLELEDKSLLPVIVFGIDSLNEDGYLEITMEDWAYYCEVELTTVERALSYIQSLEPAGIGARNLTECIQLQLNQMNIDAPYISSLMNEGITLLAEENSHQIALNYGITEEAAQKLIESIKLCHPKPGKLLSPTKTEFIIPEASIYKDDTEWKISFFNWSSPAIQINSDYSKHDLDREAASFVKKKQKEVDMLQQAIDYRSSTLEKIIRIIVEKQLPFFERGPKMLKPLTLSELSAQLDLHISTISRAIRQKYVQTAHGVLPLKYFLQREVQKGAGVASIVIKQLLKELVDLEDKSKPLSDQKIKQLMEERYQIKIARRTIVKYREELQIASSVKRKGAQDNEE
ncbi:RNA polymerase sigma-54 factor [Oceanobacillus iheyensis HTE831]|uniref:RNA polymerase sigma-54 factor n=1 Tax=Oceanobacillus iheyensis (strain DSM 14371 / CIP 107618 / JCM 11309 / KCTC 3954 / HTE831) TaxID=221109 RepID=Q8ENP0_OCEIH|nr:RNA polymerase factor sigma-54 [Oceanobacillus iheyensis]BAC14397.1 RNA polymerase sigma-54 factor [Oceanobacillus iheyensis HTE831]